jgi:sulfite exporter TauE/SafE
MGMAGSLHCVGMCGPIAMTLPLQQASGLHKLSSALLYNTGRMTTYAMGGFLFGWIGRSFQFFGWQQKISVLLGITILVFLMGPLIWKGKSLHPMISEAMYRVRTVLSRLLHNPKPTALFATGFLNGLLPCGLVYMALAGAAITGNGLEGSAFMAAFGAGTVPAMLATTYLGQWMKQPLRLKLRQIYPALMAVMAILLILRGLNLGIPLLSPKLNVSASNAIECHTR